MKPTITLASFVTPDGATIDLQKHDGEYYMRINGTGLMSTTAVASEQEMATLACAKLGDRQGGHARILIGGLGFGFTLRRVLELLGPAATIEVAELLPEIVEWNREYLREINGSCLNDTRVTVFHRDVFDLIKGSGGARNYDAILLDVDNSPDPLVQFRNERLYSSAGLAAIKEALGPRGRAAFWSGNRDRAFEKQLRRIFIKTESVAARAYPTAKRFAHMVFIADRE